MMQIKEIKSNREFKNYSATVTLTYEELRDLANGFHELCQQEEYANRPSYLKVYRNFSFLFDLVKNSCVDGWSFEHGAEVTARIAEAEELIKNGQTSK